jgi:general secretion pathway protein G
MQSNVPKKLLRAARRGVTLVEILIVLAIVALIAGGVAVVAVPELAKARIKTARVDLATLQPIADHYRGEHPTEECPTASLLKAQRLTSGTITDPWGVEYQVECQALETAVRSRGPNRVAGDADDLVQPDDDTARPR